jgi:hypothetical protein
MGLWLFCAKKLRVCVVLGQAVLKPVCAGLGDAVRLGFGPLASMLQMPETCLAAVDQPAHEDLICFRNSIPGRHYHRSVFYSQRLLLLMAVFGIRIG